MLEKVKGGHNKIEGRSIMVGTYVCMYICVNMYIHVYIFPSHIHTQINPECSLERLTLKLHCFFWHPDAKSRLTGKGPHVGKD